MPFKQYTIKCLTPPSAKPGVPLEDVTTIALVRNHLCLARHPQPRAVTRRLLHGCFLSRQFGGLYWLEQSGWTVLAGLYWLDCIGWSKVAGLYWLDCIGWSRVAQSVRWADRAD